MHKAAKEITFLLLAFASALFVCAPAIASSTPTSALENRVELFLLDGQNCVGQQAFRSANRVENYDSRWGVALESPVAPNRVAIDIGGEGRHAGALNVNPGRVTTTTGAPGRPIPNHVPFDGKRLPFGDRSVDVIHLENSPIRPGTIAEIQRVLRPGGEIRLVGPADVSASLHQQIADAVGGRVFQTTLPTRHGVPSLFTNIIVPTR